MEKSRLPPCSPTVPSGDTPCVTAGDARRVNPWREKPSHPPTPAVSNNIHTCYSPSTLTVRRFLRRTVVLSLVHGFSLAPLGHHPRLSMMRLRWRRKILCYGRSGVRHAALLRLCVAIIVCESCPQIVHDMQGGILLRTHPLSPAGTHHA